MGTIEDFQKIRLHQAITLYKDHLERIMEESNISSVAINPALADPVTGNLLRFGGSALSRSNALLSMGRLLLGRLL